MISQQVQQDLIALQIVADAALGQQLTSAVDDRDVVVSLRPVVPQNTSMDPAPSPVLFSNASTRSRTAH